MDGFFRLNWNWIYDFWPYDDDDDDGASLQSPSFVVFFLQCRVAQWFFSSSRCSRIHFHFRLHDFLDEFLYMVVFSMSKVSFRCGMNHFYTVGYYGDFNDDVLLNTQNVQDRKRILNAKLWNTWHEHIHKFPTQFSWINILPIDWPRGYCTPIDFVENVF